jgi:hypothetical protein
MGVRLPRVERPLDTLRGEYILVKWSESKSQTSFKGYQRVLMKGRWLQCNKIHGLKVMANACIGKGGMKPASYRGAQVS